MRPYDLLKATNKKNLLFWLERGVRELPLIIAIST